MEGVAVFSLFLSCAVATNSNCGGGWINHLDNCYLFQQVRLTYFNAEYNCKYHSGHLASVHSSEENHFLWTEVQHLYQDKTNEKRQMFWIGYHYNKDIDHYSWTDSSNIEYGNWKWNTTTDVSDGRSHFATICNDSLWCDVTDSRTMQYFICKKSSGITLPVYCPKESVVDPSTQHCYLVLSNKTTWQEASRQCTSLVIPGSKGRLLTINSMSESFFLGAFPSAMVISSETWINCHDIDVDGRWTDDQCQGHKLFLPSRWHQMALPGGCGVLNIYTNLWYAVECNSTKAAICEIEKDDGSIQKPSLSCLENSNQVSTQQMTYNGKRDRTTTATATATSILSRDSVVHGVLSVLLDTSSSNAKPSQYESPTNVTQNPNISNDENSKNCSGGVTCENSKDFDVTLNTRIKFQGTTERAYKKKKIQTVPPSAEPAHVAVGALGILLFVVLIGAVFISDVRMLFLHITRGVDVCGGKTKSRIKKSSSTTSVSIDLQERSRHEANSKYLTTTAALRNMGLL